MLEIKNGEANLGAAASKAYAASLKPFHGWVVRGVFAVSTLSFFFCFYILWFKSILSHREANRKSQKLFLLKKFC